MKVQIYKKGIHLRVLRRGSGESEMMTSGPTVWSRSRGRVSRGAGWWAQGRRNIQRIDTRIKRTRLIFFVSTL